jgi:putative two-component system response regulator
VLIVDDEPQNQLLLQNIFEELGYEFEIASDGVEAMAKLRLDIDLVLLDVKMPGMDGFEVAQKIRLGDEAPDVPIIMVTALDSREDRLRAVEAGANDFIAKPADLLEIRVRSSSLMKLRDAQLVLKSHQRELEKTVERRTKLLRKSLDDMTEAQRKTHEAHIDTINRLALAAEYRDKKTAAHLRRIRSYCEIIAKGIHLTPGDVETLFVASPMHDVGKIGIPDDILLKKSELSKGEFEIVKSHTTIGGSILSGSSSELLKAGEIIAMSHHERWDGTGYPKSLRGEEIPLFGRICAVADAFDALTSRRPYKEAYSNEKALSILQDETGTHFDSAIIKAFLINIDEIIETKDKHSNG